jgi:ABC-type phosphate transport system substrate-binding protein
VNGNSLLVLGGGSETPAIALVGTTGAAVNPATTPDTGSILGYFARTTPLPVSAGQATSWAVSYCQIQNYTSNLDLAVLDGAAPQPNLCPRLGALFTVGRNAYNSAADPTDTADFSISDLPIAQADYSLTAANYPARGELVQVPYFASSVAIIYNNFSAPLGTLDLTAAQICKIFDGEITDWDQIPSVDQTKAISSSNPGFPELPINVFYRTDPNGTTFSLTNWLSASVKASGRRIPLNCRGAGETWGLNPDFLTALPAPANSNIALYGASGDTGMLSGVNGLSGSFGYVTGAAFSAALNSPNDPYPSVAQAHVYGVPVTGYDKDPVLDLPATAYHITSFKKDMAVQYSCGAFAVGCTTVGRPFPDVVPLTGVYRPGCVGVIDPASYMYVSPTGYPIIGISNLELYSSGNGIYAPGLQKLADLLQNGASLANPTGTTNYGPGGLTTIDQASQFAEVGTTGFSSLSIPNVLLTNTYIGMLPNCIS